MTLEFLSVCVFEFVFCVCRERERGRMKEGTRFKIEKSCVVVLATTTKHVVVVVASVLKSRLGDYCLLSFENEEIFTSGKQQKSRE